MGRFRAAEVSAGREVAASAGAADGEAEEEGRANDGEAEGECSRPGISPRSNALRPQPAIRIRYDQNASTSTYAAASGQHPVVHVDSMIRRCDRPGDSSPVDPGQPAPQVRHCQPATGLILAGAVHRQETRIGAAAPSPSRPIRKPPSSDSTQPLRDHPTRRAPTLLAASLAWCALGFARSARLILGWRRTDGVLTRDEVPQRLPDDPNPQTDPPNTEQES